MVENKFSEIQDLACEGRPFSITFNDRSFLIMIGWTEWQVRVCRIQDSETYRRSVNGFVASYPIPVSKKLLMFASACVSRELN